MKCGFGHVGFRLFKDKRRRELRAGLQSQTKPRNSCRSWGKLIGWVIPAYNHTTSLPVHTPALFINFGPQ
jgi:hypothetical protein